jgi:hypothetical protein
VKPQVRAQEFTVVGRMTPPVRWGPWLWFCRRNRSDSRAAAPKREAANVPGRHIFQIIKGKELDHMNTTNRTSFHKGRLTSFYQEKHGLGKLKMMDLFQPPRGIYGTRHVPRPRAGEAWERDNRPHMFKPAILGSISIPDLSPQLYYEVLQTYMSVSQYDANVGGNSVFVSTCGSSRFIG